MEIKPQMSMVYKLCNYLTRSNINTKDITGVIVSSVVPNIMHSLENMLKKCFCHEPIIVGPGVKTGINIKV